MVERVIPANGMEIWTEDFGHPAHVPILLVMGATGQAIQWEDEFCQALVAGRRRVLRFDIRDTGKSTCVDFDAHPYTLRDLANDAVGILDVYRIASAHIVGISMGGMIAQTMAIEHAARVRSITSISSTPLAATGLAANDAQGLLDLPAAERDFSERVVQALREMPVDRQQRICWRVNFFAMLAGSLAAFDREGFRALAALEVDRARNYSAMANHVRAIEASEPKDRRPLLRKLDVPALIVHGTEDAIFHLDHAKATAQALRDCELLAIEKMGHELPRAAWPAVVAAILSHTQRAQQRSHESCS